MKAQDIKDATEEGYRTGIREVVDFVVDEIFPLLDMASVSVNFKDRWNNKVKEWERKGQNEI